MQVKYVGSAETLALEYGKVYSVISIENGRYRILTELKEDYLVPPEAFEIVLKTLPLLNDVKYVCLDKEELKDKQLSKGTCIFFCSEHFDNDRKNVIRKLLYSGCREFHFFGKWAGEWENLTGDVVVTEHIEENNNEAVMTMSYNSSDREYPEDIACILCSFFARE